MTDAESIEYALLFIDSFIEKSKTYQKSMTSYGLKHMAERYSTTYISNDDFKAAMIMRGHQPKDVNELNHIYKIKKMTEKKLKLYYRRANPYLYASRYGYD